ncbi:unnamed protein product [Diatraea saccharalis]|uniref:Sialomucin core protein 24 n=1 Tax=Diatraea saccharalis TaxID=40085 RepID=A0A9N9R1J6_9NEOP|nr:unnamed protein product [Diatraea saccharalis]
MKKVIFICLLSISTCLSRPDGAPNVAPPAAPNPQIQTQSSPSSPPLVATHKENAKVSENTTNETSPAVTVGTAPSTPPAVPTSTPPAVAMANATAPKNSTDTNKTTDKNETVSPSNVATKNETSTQPSTKPTPENKSVPNTTDHTMKNETTTLKPTSKPSEVPKSTDTPPVQTRRFDGPSFIGGIILTLGLLAIGFMGFKYYKNQTERNYHTL